MKRISLICSFALAFVFVFQAEITAHSKMLSNLLIAPIKGPFEAFAQSNNSAQEQDFVPGEKMIFFDDFTDMAKGAAPPHWKVRGSAVKLMPEGRLMLQNRGQLYANLKNLPKNFTVEMDFQPEYEGSTRILRWWFETADESYGWSVDFHFSDGEIEVRLESHGSAPDVDEHGSVPFNGYGKPAKLAIWFQDSRLRAYINGQRGLDLNQLEFKPVNLALVNYDLGETPVYMGSVRIAQSMPDISQTMFSTGRYVSHNILFDVNSDKLRPESMNVLKEIADALQKQATLKVRIEGHTDSTGDAAKNLDLSKRRAESVKSALVKLGISADRLTTDGLGQTKPLSTNDTPEGRAENRRVEFVKI